MRFTGVASMAALAAVLLPACGAVPLGNGLQSPDGSLEKRDTGHTPPAAPGESLEKRGHDDSGSWPPAAPGESLEKRAHHEGPAAPGESLEKRKFGRDDNPAAPGESLE